MSGIVYLLCGLPGSGKTTYAKTLEQQGVIRYTLDEELFKQYGKDFPPEKYSEYEIATKQGIIERLKQDISTGKSTVLDWGFWKRAERDDIKQLVGSLGAQCKLLYFKTDSNELLVRVQIREQENNHAITADLLERFKQEFEEPSIEEGFEVPPLG
ncbi:MAG: ATP-binding protein [Candidatus Buchananbacteria bacterium]|nr:ATP-binding protein [Candidatus Buchananbacteria bacterium]